MKDDSQALKLNNNPFEPLTLNVRVTREDIKRGKQVNCNGCPIALAVKRLVKGHPRVKPGPALVGATVVCLKEKGTKRFVYGNLPKVAKAFIAKFDQELKVSPFRFKLLVEEHI